MALVTTYIEQLSMLGLVLDPLPLFGAEGGMWIGYRLSDRCRDLATSENDLRRNVAELTGGPRTEVSEAVADLQTECQEAELNENYREDFLKTLDEIRICFDHGCFIAAIGLCGKILEVCLKEVLLRHDINCDPNAMLGTLIKSIRERVPSEYLGRAVDGAELLTHQGWADVSSPGNLLKECFRFRISPYDGQNLHRR